VFFATKKGIVKKTDLMAYAHPRPSGIIAIGLDAGDEVIGIRLTDGRQEIILSTRSGQSIRFKEEEARSMGRSAGGVKGITLEPTDEVVSIEILSQGASVLTVAENGYGKRTDTGEYRVQARGGKGIITMKTTERTGPVVGVQQVTDEDNLMLVTSNGKIIRLRVADIRVIGRNTQGVRLIDTEPGERVVSLARLAEREEDDEESGPPA
jgi:DNA gyrase subunit A